MVGQALQHVAYIHDQRALRRIHIKPIAFRRLQLQTGFFSAEQKRDDVDVFVRFGPSRADQELVQLGRLARDNPGVTPADPEDWELPETPQPSDS